jgi:1-acyl-sn-glycerol-3-phosphate acyltransferase
MGLWVYKTSRWLLRRAFWCMGGLEVRGRQLTPPEGPLIVACSHASHLDPMILGAAFDRPLHFMARRTLFDVPGFNWLIRANQAFPLNREGDSREALRVCGELLDQGKAVVMFPEGTRSHDGVFGEVKPGVGMLAVRNLVPVLPVYNWGNFQSWPRGRSFPRRHRLKTFIGPVITPSADRTKRKGEQSRINDEVASAIRALERAAWEGEEGVPETLRERWATDAVAV